MPCINRKVFLGLLVEKGLNGTLSISYGQNTAWFIIRRPVCLILPGLTVVALVIPCFRRRGTKDIFASGEPDVL